MEIEGSSEEEKVDNVNIFNFKSPSPESEYEVEEILDKRSMKG